MCYVFCWQTERRLRVVALKVAEEFQQRGDILDELVFAPDLPLSVRRYLPAAVARMGLRSVQCQKDGKIYVTIQFRVRVDKVSEISFSTDFSARVDDVNGISIAVDFSVGVGRCAGFFLLSEDFWGRCDESIPACT